MNKKFKVGETVWVDPNDAKVCKGKVIGFQKVEPFHPIVEAVTTYGKKFSNAFSPDRVNHYRDGKKFPRLKVVYE